MPAEEVRALNIRTLIKWKMDSLCMVQRDKSRTRGGNDQKISFSIT